MRGTGTRWQIAESDPLPYDDPEEPARVLIAEEAPKELGAALAIAPCSVTLFNLETE